MNAYFVYFLAGIVSSVLFTVQIRCMDHDRRVAASFTSFAVTALNLSILFNIFTSLQGQEGIMGIIWYSFGIGVGTFVAMKLKLRYKGKDLIG